MGLELAPQPPLSSGQADLSFQSHQLHTLERSAPVRTQVGRSAGSHVWGSGALCSSEGPLPPLLRFDAEICIEV